MNTSRQTIQKEGKEETNERNEKLKLRLSFHFRELRLRLYEDFQTISYQMNIDDSGAENNLILNKKKSCRCGWWFQVLNLIN